MFSGSGTFNTSFISAIDKVGATDRNGTTNTDRTNYFENVPTSMLDYTLLPRSDRMGHLLRRAGSEEARSATWCGQTRTATR